MPLRSGNFYRLQSEETPLRNSNSASCITRAKAFRRTTRRPCGGTVWQRTEGKASAQVNLGSMYHEGQGVPQDDKEAVRWSRLAAEQADPDASATAQFNLGVCYHKGQGVPQDDREAVRWLRLAAEQADPDAQAGLGESYDEGRGVPQDYVQAYMWFNLAGASGKAGVIERRDNIVSKMTPDQIAEAQRRAREWKPRTSRQPMQLSNTMDWPQIIIAAGTCVLVFLTWWLVKGQLSTAREQLRIELYLQFRRDFDGDRLISARKKLAQQLLEDTPHDEIQENVMDFFEDMGMQLRRGYLDREMIWDTFSYYAKMWGSACKDYIDAERRTKHSSLILEN